MNIFKKLNARGFTLIELIATIALLAIIAMISFVSINAVIKNNKERQYKNLVSSIQVAAKEYASDNKYTDEFANKSQVTIPLSKLNSYLTMPVIDPYTNEEINNLQITLSIDKGIVKNVVISGLPEHSDS